MTRWLHIGVSTLSCLLLGACAASSGGYGNIRHATPMATDVTTTPDTTDDRVMYLELIRKMQHQGRYYASLAHVDEYARRYGTSPALDILHASALRHTGQPQAAAAIYRTLRDGPQAAAAWHGLGLVAASGGHYAQAAHDLDQATILAPIDASYLGDLGYAYLHTGDLARARGPLARAAELAPDNDKAVANLALLLTLEGHSEKARDMMDKAHLPDATRQAVTRQATLLRRQYRQTSRAATTPASRVPTSSPITPATNRRLVEMAPNHGISANILDRFHQTPATGGARHEQP